MEIFQCVYNYTLNFFANRIEYSGFSHLPLWKEASLGHVCITWYLSWLPLKTLSMSSLTFQSMFAVLSFYDRFYNHWDTHSESRCSLPELPLSKIQKEAGLPFVTDWSEGQQYCLDLKFSRKRILLHRDELSGCVPSVQAHLLWIALWAFQE